MAQALKATQITTGEFAGFWPPSLRAFNLAPKPESTGTAFCVGSLAWGIAEGILPPEEYLHVRACSATCFLFFVFSPCSEIFTAWLCAIMK
jgi:rhamnogalacturonyl hydrolase YesR